MLMSFSLTASRDLSLAIGGAAFVSEELVDAIVAQAPPALPGVGLLKLHNASYATRAVVEVTSASNASRRVPG